MRFQIIEVGFSRIHLVVKFGKAFGQLVEQRRVGIRGKQHSVITIQTACRLAGLMRSGLAIV